MSNQKLVLKEVMKNLKFQQHDLMILFLKIQEFLEGVDSLYLEQKVLSQVEEF